MQPNKAILRIMTCALLCLVASPFAHADAIGSFDMPMSFAWASTGGNCEGCAWVSAIGVIEKDTPARFKEFASKNPYHFSVYFHSPGGNLMAALELGRFIREAGVNTSVYDTIPDNYGFYKSKTGICASACAYAFFGGVNRYIPGGSQLGFHQFYRDAAEAAASSDDTLQQLGISADQFITGLLVAYTVEMGVDARILTVASSTSSNEMVSLSEEEFDALNVTTKSGFGDWWMEPFGVGLIAAARALDSYSDERQVTIYCRASDQAPIIMVSLTRYPGYELSEKDFRAAIFDASIHAGSTEAKIAPSSIEFSAVRDFFVVRVPLSRDLMRLLGESDGIAVEINMPHAMFDYGVHAIAPLPPQAQKMIRLAAHNCV